ncbi:hypothetical protein CROQUDRAFT_297380 [Cronartium quercuum f. sp. fusiforme G11]|uniref:Uncharacterized protein n=1 Tax=Cronartium quercuum f. sp. fusiforme G11 TaxID=708437 RepID=A0A9P6N8I5_9BASI|nr:hypothetical protein CROQUDRAFT_297380 [Cronartium quercuum f. sp. fusiforme G11]
MLDKDRSSKLIFCFGSLTHSSSGLNQNLLPPNGINSVNGLGAYNGVGMLNGPNAYSPTTPLNVNAGGYTPGVGLNSGPYSQGSLVGGYGGSGYPSSQYGGNIHNSYNSLPGYNGVGGYQTTAFNHNAGKMLKVMFPKRAAKS